MRTTTATPAFDWPRFQALRGAGELIEEISASELPELRLQQQLRKRYDAGLVRDALQLVDARRRASGKFSRAGEMWFDRVGFEQASGELVAVHKAARFEGTVWDLCCGIGGDAVALAGRGAVVAVDREPGRVLCCRANAEACQVADSLRVLVADVRHLGPSNGLLHIDPDQRGGKRGRSRRIEDAEPDREFLEQMLRTSDGGAIKLSPAANFLGKFAGSEIELVSIRGECKQAVVWFGALAGTPPPGQPQLFRATVLPGGESLYGHPLAVPLRVEPPGDYLFDPDPSVVRSGLVDVLAEQQGWWRLDDSEEYLTGSAPQGGAGPFARSFRVEAITANRVPAIREAARAAGLGPVEIKCRHVPTDADLLRRKLRLEGPNAGVILVARVAGRTRAVIARRGD